MRGRRTAGGFGATWRTAALFVSLDLCLLAAPVAAQTGGVKGRVLDTDGRGLPGATVTVRSAQAGASAPPASALTDAQGAFAMPAVAPGQYEIKAEMSGFGVETAVVTVRSPGEVEVLLTLRHRYTETVVVSASRTEQTLISAPATVTVISADEIAARGADDFGDLLTGTAGLNVTRLNPRDIAFDFRTAGGILGRSQLVMVDGRSLNREGFGLVFWDLFSGNFDDIAQVELIATPGSAVWGANALRGVINVRTKTPKEDPGGAAAVGLGTVGVRLANLRYAQVRDRLSYRVSGGFFEEDAWGRDPKLPDGSPMPVTAIFPNQGTKQTKFDLRADWEGQPGRVWTTNLGFADSSGVIHTSTGPNAWADKGSYALYGSTSYRTRSYDAKVYWNRLRGDTKSVLFGDDFKTTSDTVTGDIVGHRALNDKHALSAGASASLNFFDLTLAPGDSFRSTVGGFVEDLIALTPKLTASVGARLDKFDSLAATFSPRASLVYRPSPTRALRLAFNRAFRAPSVLETFARTDLVNVIPLFPGLPPVSFSTLVTGNKALDPEIMRAVEIGYTTSIGPRVTFSATAYYNSDLNNVRFATVETYSPANPPAGWPLPPQFVPPLPKTLSWVNVGTTRDQGIELTGRVAFGRGVSARASYSLQDDTKATKVDPRYALQLNRPPRHQAALGVIYAGQKWRGSVDGSHTGEAFWSDVLDSRFWGTTPSYVQVNAKLARALYRDKAFLNVSATNLFDRKIKQHVFGDIMRRHLTAALRASW